MKLQIIFFLLLCLISFLPICQADEIVVDINGAGDYNDIQSGINAASDGDVVVVKSGKYVTSVSIDFNPLYDPRNPDPSLLKNITVISEEGPDVTSLEFVESNETPVWPRSAVYFKSGENEFSELSGFKISGCDYFAVACNNNSSPTLSNLSLTNNKGGIVCDLFASPLVKKCIITKNHGYGIFGGGYSNAVINSCRIIEQFAFAGVFLAGRATLTFYDCLISGNSGSGVFCDWESSARLINSEISGNGRGGVDYLFGPCNLQNCTIYGNKRSGISGGGEFGTIDHCTFYENALSGLSCHPQTSIMNCIVWNDEVSLLFSEPIISNCLLTYPLVGETFKNNMVSNPLFVDEGVIDFARYKTVEIMGEEVELPDFIIQRPDLRLQLCSPAIDNGNPMDFILNEDKNGVERPCWGGYDIGAYEYCGDVEPYKVKQFILGDVNEDGKVDLADAVFILQYIYIDGRTPNCFDAADTNNDGDLDLGDAVMLLGYLYTDAESLLVPLGLCGPDNTEDELTCETYKFCE